MNRAFIPLSLCLMAAAVWLLWQPVPKLTVIGVQARPLADGRGALVTLDIVNSGDPDSLTGVEIAEGTAQLIGPGALPVPAEVTASLVPEGSHIVLSNLRQPVSAGALLPMHLTFAQAGRMAVKARVVSQPAAPATYAVSSDAPPPGLSIDLRRSENGWYVDMAVSNFTLSGPEAEVVARPGVGHAHIHIDGVKVGRAYETGFRLPALSPGQYTVDVTLATNDHRICQVDGQSVTATATLVIPD